MGVQSKERMGSNFAMQRSGAIVLQARRAKHIQSKKLAVAIWQPWEGTVDFSFSCLHQPQHPQQPDSDGGIKEGH